MTKEALCEATNFLISFGFTQLESEIYIHLLTHHKCTGYSVAKALGKATANIYKAIETLKKKGALEIAASNSKVLTPRPWPELLAQYRREFDKNFDNLECALSKLKLQENIETVYQIESLEILIEKSLSIVLGAEKVILADIQPQAVPYFQAALSEAVAKGVDVRVKVYEPIAIDNATVVLRENGKEVYQRTNDVSFTICADGRESVLGLIDKDVSYVIQAFTTKSPLMNMQLFNGLLYELVLTEIKKCVRDNDFLGIKEVLKGSNYLNPYSESGPQLASFLEQYQTD